MSAKSNEQLNALVLSLAPPPAEHLIFIEKSAIDTDSLRSFCEGQKGKEDADVTFFLVQSNSRPLADLILATDTTNKTVFVAAGCVSTEDQEHLRGVGISVMEVHTGGRPVHDCVAQSEQTSFDKEQWHKVYDILKPGASDEEYESDWVEFQTLKQAHTRRG